MATSGVGQALRGWAVRARRVAASALTRTPIEQGARGPGWATWLFGAPGRDDAAGIATVLGVGASIAAAVGLAAGTSTATGGSVPPLGVGKAAVVQLSYRNSANPVTGTVTAGGADLAVSAVDASTDRITVTGHGYIDFDGDGPVVWDTAAGGTVPAGLTNGAQYWIGIVDANTLKLATSDVNAATGVWVNITSAGSGTHTLLRAQNTQQSQSIFITAAIRGDWDNVPGTVAPYDNKGNTYTSIDAGPYAYSAWPTAKMGVFASPYRTSVGGNDHRWYLDYGPYAIAGAEADEVAVAAVEIQGPAEIIASSYQEVTVPAASFNSLSVTISRAATLICVVGGSAGLGQQHVFTFSGITGITKIAAASAEAEISANGYTQVAIASASVDPAGTPTSYTATIAGTSNEVGKVWLIAVAEPQVGLASGTSDAAAVGASVAASAGTAAGTSDATAVGEAISSAVGSAAGTSTATAEAQTGSIGSAAGTSDAAAVGTAITSADGASSGTGAATATGDATATGAGDSTGTGAASAVGSSVAASVGESAGTGDASAVGASVASAAGSSAGTSAGAGVGSAVAAADGASAGASGVTAAGLGIASGAGASAGTSDATAAGVAIAGAVGSAAGTSTATATGTRTVEGGIVPTAPRTFRGSLMVRLVAINVPEVV